MNIITQNWELIIGLIGSIIAFFSGRKLKKAEETKNTSDALTSMQTTYDTWVRDFKERYDELKTEIKEYRSEQLKLREEMVDLRRENSDLRRELKEWEGRYTKLKKEFDSYKKTDENR